VEGKLKNSPSFFSAMYYLNKNKGQIKKMARKTFTQKLKGTANNNPSPSAPVESSVKVEKVEVAPPKPVSKPKSPELRIHELEQKVDTLEKKIEKLVEVLNDYTFLTAKHKGNKLPL
jgi:hypothetical protein